MNEKDQAGYQIVRSSVNGEALTRRDGNMSIRNPDGDIVLDVRADGKSAEATLAVGENIVARLNATPSELAPTQAEWIALANAVEYEAVSLGAYLRDPYRASLRALGKMAKELRTRAANGGAA